MGAVGSDDCRNILAYIRRTCSHEGPGLNHPASPGVPVIHRVNGPRPLHLRQNAAFQHLNPRPKACRGVEHNYLPTSTQGAGRLMCRGVEGEGGGGRKGGGGREWVRSNAIAHQAPRLSVQRWLQGRATPLHHRKDWNVTQACAGRRAYKCSAMVVYSCVSGPSEPGSRRSTVIILRGGNVSSLSAAASFSSIASS